VAALGREARKSPVNQAHKDPANGWLMRAASRRTRSIQNCRQLSQWRQAIGRKIEGACREIFPNLLAQDFGMGSRRIFVTTPTD
jgi:hypothetical protein